MQEVFTRAWRHAERYDPTRGSVRTWLYQIARHAIIDMRRRAVGAARRSRCTSPPLTRGRRRRDSIEQAMLGWQVAAALERLTPEHRQMIRLAHVQGLSVREIAEQLRAARSAPSRAAPGTRCARCGWCSRRWGSSRDPVRRAPPFAGRLRARCARADEAARCAGICRTAPSAPPSTTRSSPLPQPARPRRRGGRGGQRAAVARVRGARCSTPSRATRRPTRRRAGSAVCAASCARAGSRSGRRPPPPWLSP